ncbi:MAG TPA: hypothetical protein VHE35_09005, partial [Kofleriaceae bacterium]|nr:hypothetical protein [Kofleriaceae bacterium]
KGASWTCTRPTQPRGSIPVPVMQCGVIRPLLHAGCTSACGNDSRTFFPDHPVPLTLESRRFEQQCQNGPTASTWLSAFCGAAGSSATLNVQAKAQRDGDCTNCVGSGSYAAFEWLSTVSKIAHPRGEYHVTLRGSQTSGQTAPSRCKAYIGSMTVDWSQFATADGYSYAWDGKTDVQVKVQCTDANGAFVGAGMQGGSNCRYVEEEGTLAITIATTPAPKAPSPAPPRRHRPHHP